MHKFKWEKKGDEWIANLGRRQWLRLYAVFHKSSKVWSCEARARKGKGSQLVSSALNESAEVAIDTCCKMIIGQQLQQFRDELNHISHDFDIGAYLQETNDFGDD